MRLTAAAATLLMVCTLAACGDDPGQVSASDQSDRTASSADTPQQTDGRDLLSLNAACGRIWGLFKRHGNLPAGEPWDALTSGARNVLARSQPDVVATLEPEVEAFEAAKVHRVRGDDDVIAAIQSSNRLIRHFAAACGQEFETVVKPVG